MDVETMEEARTHLQPLLDGVSGGAFRMESLQVAGEHSNVYLIQIEGTKYILKVAKAPATFRQRLSYFVWGNQAIRNEARVYKALKRSTFAHLNYPQLIATDAERYLLLEYVNSAPIGVASNNPALADHFARGLAEFHLADLDLGKRLPVLDFRVRHKVFFKLMRSLLKAPRNGIPLLLVVRCLAVALRCHAAQKKIKPAVLLHNDLNRGNFLVDEEGRGYLIDFSYVARAPKWVLSDVIDYAYDSNRRFFVNPDIMRAYLMQLRASTRLAHVVDVKAQIRILMLLKIMGSIGYRAQRGRGTDDWITFLETILLDDGAFDGWYRALCGE